ncbi:MAG: ABC transporter permease [Christensenellaceae bacterium]|nr:ABC transporter permease [Christensenellaceae bacterium]
MSKHNLAGLSAERRLYLRLERRQNTLVISARILLLLGFIALWELSARFGLIDPFIMSQPSRIAATIADLYRQGELFSHIGISCLETVIGFLSGTGLGVIIAILLWWSPTLSKVIEPYLVVLGALPKVALGPIFIVWMGAGAGAIIAMTLAISLIVTIMEVLGAFLSTDTEKIKLLKTFGAGRIRIFLKVVLPSSLPAIVNSLKVNMGLSWVGVIMGEFLVSRSGLGYLIVYGSQVFQMDLVMASVIILAAAAALMYQGVRLLEKKVIKNAS